MYKQAFCNQTNWWSLMEQFEYNTSNLYLNHRTCTNYVQHGLFWLRPDRHIYPKPHLFIYAFVFIPKQSWSDLSGWQLWVTLMQRDTENIWSWSTSTCTTRSVALDFSDLNGLVCDVALALNVKAVIGSGDAHLLGMCCPAQVMVTVYFPGVCG